MIHSAASLWLLITGELFGQLFQFLNFYEIPDAQKYSADHHKLSFRHLSVANEPSANQESDHNAESDSEVSHLLAPSMTAIPERTSRRASRLLQIKKWGHLQA